MTSGSPTRNSTRGKLLFGGVLSVFVVVILTQVLPDFFDRRPTGVPSYTVEEMRQRPDVTEVVPAHAQAAAAVTDTLGQAAGTTWNESDLQVFGRQLDGKEPQLVDGYPVLRWQPELITAVEPATLDDATLAALADAWEGTLEPLGYDVSTVNRSVKQNRYDLTFTASNDQDASLRLFGRDGERLRLVVMTSVHVYRDASCLPDPTTCEPDLAELTDAL